MLLCCTTISLFLYFMVIYMGKGPECQCLRTAYERLFTSFISPCWAEISNHKNTSSKSIWNPTQLYLNPNAITLL